MVNTEITALIETHALAGLSVNQSMRATGITDYQYSAFPLYEIMDRSLRRD